MAERDGYNRIKDFYKRNRIPLTLYFIIQVL